MISLTPEKQLADAVKKAQQLAERANVPNLSKQEFDQLREQVESLINQENSLHESHLEDSEENSKSMTTLVMSIKAALNKLEKAEDRLYPEHNETAQNVDNLIDSARQLHSMLHTKEDFNLLYESMSKLIADSKKHDFKGKWKSIAVQRRLSQLEYILGHIFNKLRDLKDDTKVEFLMKELTNLLSSETIK